MTKPLISVIVPTRNSAVFLRECLTSIKAQTYPNIELIVVDRDSTDDTKKIAKEYTENIYNYGPERSAQVNYAVARAKGAYVYKVDSDFTIDSHVVEQCVAKVTEGYDAVVVHNTPDITISWIAKIRKFEVDMYKYDITHSSARFVQKTVYENIQGFNEKITEGEDYDFQNKLNRAGYKTGFIDAEAIHHGEPKHFWPHMKKFYIYGKDFVNYQVENTVESKKQLAFGRSVYFKHWRKFVRSPILAIGFVTYNFFKYGFGGAGLVRGKIMLSRAKSS